MHDMEATYVIFAAIAGIATGWVQFKLLQLTLEKGRAWLIAVKLPLWALCMIVAVAVSLPVLAGFMAGATVSFVAFGYAWWRSRNKGE